MSTLNLVTINFQDPLRSRPIRENFTDIQNVVNDQERRINALITAASGSEVVDARDYHSSLSDRLHSASKAQGNVVISGGVVTAQPTPNMTVHVSAGEALINGVAVKWDAMNSGTITAPSNNPRYDVVVINADNTLSIESGSESASPQYPDISQKTQLPIACIYLIPSMTRIESTDITDWRIIKKINVTSYNFMAADAGKFIASLSSSPVTMTIVQDTHDIGTRIDVVQYGTGQVTISAGSGVTLRKPMSSKLRLQYSVVSLYCIAANEYLLVGDVEV